MSSAHATKKTTPEQQEAEVAEATAIIRTMSHTQATQNTTTEMQEAEVRGEERGAATGDHSTAATGYHGKAARKA